MSDSIVKMICESCGGHDLEIKNGYAVCKACGTKYLIKDAEDPNKYNRYYVQGDTLFREGNYDDAKKYFDFVIEHNTDSTQANFYSRMCKLMSSNKDNIIDNINSFTNSFPNLVHLIRNEKTTDDSKNLLIGIMYLTIQNQVRKLIERTKHNSNYGNYSESFAKEIQYMLSIAMIEWDETVSKELKFKDENEDVVGYNKQIYRQLYECQDYNPREIKPRMDKVMKRINKYEPDWVGYIGNGLWMH